jgi:hypothetical protein
MPADKLRKRIDRLLDPIVQPVRNAVSAARISLELPRGRPIADLTLYERRVYSQNGEDGILQAIFARVGTTNRFFVEFGVGDGRQCNTAYLARKKGWTGLMMDAGAQPHQAPVEIQRELITAENIRSLLEKYRVPPSFDLLSIDIDGSDYWVWRGITQHHPRVVVIEYNASVPPTESRTIEYEPTFKWSGTDYFGASVLALKKLGEAKGYTLVGCDSSGTNAFFVDDTLAPGRFTPAPIERLYRPPAYGDGKGHPRDPHRHMITV